MDPEGYPDDVELNTIAEWSYEKSYTELFEFIRRRWRFAEWGWSETNVLDDDGKPIVRYHISTGGWSGNESLIAAFHQNFIAWGQCWVQHRRGGHYIFEIRKEDA